jgi:hypothetical protein
MPLYPSYLKNSFNQRNDICVLLSFLIPIATAQLHNGEQNIASLIHQSVPDVLSLQLFVLDDSLHKIMKQNFSMIPVLLYISALFTAD